MKLFARAVSWVFHPVIFSLIAPFVIIYRSTSDAWYALKWTIFSIFFLVLALAILYLVQPKDFFSDFDMYKREKRILFYLIACGIAILYFIVAVSFKGMLFPLSILALGIIIGIVLLEIVTFYIKASIHVAVVCSYIITVGVLYGGVVFFSLLWMAPLVAWSRLELKRHTIPEVIAGALVGGTITTITLFIAKMLSS